MERIGKDFEQIYVNLSKNHRNMPKKVICKVCKTTLRNGKLPQFVVPENIRRNKPLLVVATLSELEERLIALRISFAKIRQWGHKRSQMGLTRSIINVLVHNIHCSNCTATIYGNHNNSCFCIEKTFGI